MTGISLERMARDTRGHIMRTIRWLAIPAMLALGAGALWYSTNDATGIAAVPSTSLTAVARSTTVSESVAATGTIEPAAQYALAFGAAPAVVSTGSTSAGSTRDWTVTAVDVALGDRVTAGQVLATADTADVQADIDELAVQIAEARQALDDVATTRAEIKATTRDRLDAAEDDLTVAQLNVANAKAAYDDASGTTLRRQARISVIQAKAQLTTAKQAVADLKDALKGEFPEETQAVATAQASLAGLERELADLQAQLAAATLRAPADGLVSELNLIAGYAAPSGTAIVVDSGTLQVVADVVESDLASIALDQAATVTVDALDLEAAGTVTAIAPSTTGSTSSVVTYPVIVTITDPDARIRAGMSTDVTIATAVADNVVAVPVSALQGADGDYTVDVIGDDGSTTARAVTVGLVTETLAEVRSGIDAGERVVVGTNTARASTDDATDAGTGLGGLTGGGGFPGGGQPPSGGFPGRTDR
jgi:macrolide-specific efflux system membrane fusion protein